MLTINCLVSQITKCLHPSCSIPLGPDTSADTRGFFFARQLLFPKPPARRHFFPQVNDLHYLSLKARTNMSGLRMHFKDDGWDVIKTIVLKSFPNPRSLPSPTLSSLFKLGRKLEDINNKRMSSQMNAAPWCYTWDGIE